MRISFSAVLKPHMKNKVVSATRGDETWPEYQRNLTSSEYALQYRHHLFMERSELLGLRC